jgi:Rrf2 family protein
MRVSSQVRCLEQVFQRLRRAGLVTARRGPGGGHRLARAASEITLRDVVEAVEGPIGSDRGSVATSVTLESLCRDAARPAVRHANEDARMYFI